MTRIGSTAVISHPPDEFVSTHADTESPMSRGDIADDRSNEEWQRLLDQLIEWVCHPDSLADVGVEPPGRNAVQLAARVLRELKKNGVRYPDRIVPDPNGGIVIEYDGTPEFQFHIWDDGTVDFCTFEGARLVGREAIL